MAKKTTKTDAKSALELTVHIPVAQYGFLEAKGGEDRLEDLVTLYNKYGENKIKVAGAVLSGGVFREVTTFTGETIKYDEISHTYTDMKGNRLISGSEYKKAFDKPFDSEKIANMTGSKYGVPGATVAAMWKANSKISTTFGTAIHLAMEQYFKYRDSGTEKEYHMSKNIFLRHIVTTFPGKDLDILPEVFVSHTASRKVGQIDGLVFVNREERRLRVIDYKSDAEIGKNLAGHYKQLSFYADILTNAGYIVEGLTVYNYTNEWTEYHSEVLPIDMAVLENIK